MYVEPSEWGYSLYTDDGELIASSAAEYRIELYALAEELGATIHIEGGNY